MEDWNTSGIYMLTCKVNGKKYIGQAQNIRKRLCAHKSNKHKYHNQIIKNAIKKYGWKNFEPIVLEFCPVDKLDEREIYYISELKPEYNIAAGGRSGNRGYKHSKATREKLKEIAEEKKVIFQKPIICLETEEIFESINLAAEKAGIQRTGISMALNGKTKTAGGYHWEYLNKEDKISEEMSYNLGCANRGRKQSAEQIAKRVAHLKGKKSKNYNAYKSVVCVETGEIFKSVKIAGLEVGVHPTLISKVLHGKKRTAGGYHWQFLDDYNENGKIIYYNKPVKKPVICVETGEIFPSIKKAAESLGIKHPNSISAVLNGRQKSAGGYHWKLIEKETDKND